MKLPRLHRRALRHMLVCVALCLCLCRHVLSSQPLPPAHSQSPSVIAHPSHPARTREESIHSAEHILSPTPLRHEPVQSHSSYNHPDTNPTHHTSSQKEFQHNSAAFDTEFDHLSDEEFEQHLLKNDYDDSEFEDEDDDDDDDDDDDEFEDDDDDDDEDDDIEYNYERSTHPRNHKAVQFIHEDEEHVHMAFYEGEDLGTDQAAISVHINDQPATNVYLHNSSVLSFRVPFEVLKDPTLRASAIVRIHIHSSLRVTLQLNVLQDQIFRVNLSQFSLQLSSSPSHPPDISSPSSDDDPVSQWINEAEALLAFKTAKGNRRAIPLLLKAHHAGNATATTTLASMYLFAPDGIKRDVSTAVAMIQNASSVGEPDAQGLLGFLHASGFAAPLVPVHVGAAILLWSVAAEGGSQFARMALAFRFYTGTDVEEDCDKAAEYYQLVAKDVYNDLMKDSHPASSSANSEGWSDNILIEKEIRPPGPRVLKRSELNFLDEGGARVAMEMRDEVQYYRHLAERGHADAQLVLGTLHYYGEMGMAKDMVEARRYFERASKQNNYEAHAALAFIDMRSGDIGSAVRHLRTSAENGNKIGVYGWAYLMLRGIGMKGDTKKAVELFAKAAEHKHLESVYNLAILHAKGVGVKASIKKSFDLLKNGASQGHLLSSYKLGTMYAKGLMPTNRDCREGVKLLKFVAQHGMWGKVLWRALRGYDRGLYEDSLVRYLYAAHAGLEVGQFNAGFLYEHGLVRNWRMYGGEMWRQGVRMRRRWVEDVDGKNGGRSEMVEKSVGLYQMSASQGSSDALVRIGDLVFREQRDYKRAAGVYERAAKEGKNAEAMFNLGLMHMRGYGMNADKHIAKRYFDDAIDHDPDNAYIAASLGLLLLRSLDRVAEWMQTLRGWERRVSKVGVDGGGLGFEAVVEVVAMTTLLGVLGVVMHLRQRRLMRREEEAGEARRRREGEVGEEEED